MSYRQQIWIASAMAAVAVFAPQVGHAQPAEQVYKNITHLKGTPADQLVPAMQFISTSLGVTCAYCHVDGKPEADDKPRKKTAREMMAMVIALNKDRFNGRQTVTCYTCHRGVESPVNIPPVLESDTPAVPPAPPGANAIPATADQIAAKYLEAVGGADAVRKITTRVMKGAVIVAGSQTPIDLYTKAPNKRVSISHGQNSNSYTAFDGTAGWLGSTGRPARDMSAQESWASSLDAEFALALRLKEIFPQLRRGRPEQINGVDCVVLNATAQGKPPVRLWFDASSGLLVRMLRSADTSMGRLPTQIDYADYREVDGVKVPFRWTLSRVNGRFTIQLSEVNQCPDR